MARELANTEFIAGAVVRTEDTEELIVPQVLMLFAYSGNNIEVKKDEVSIIDYFFFEEFLFNIKFYLNYIVLRFGVMFSLENLNRFSSEILY